MKNLFFSLRLKFISVLAILLVVTTASIAWISTKSFSEENENLVLELNSLSSVTIATQVQDYFEHIATSMAVLGREIYQRSELDEDSEFIAVALLSPDSKSGFRLEKGLFSSRQQGNLQAQWYDSLGQYLEQSAQGTLQVFPIVSGEHAASLIGFAIPYYEVNGEAKGRVLVGALSTQALVNLIGGSNYGTKFLVNSRGILLLDSTGLKQSAGADLTNHASVKSFLDRSFNNGQFLTGAHESDDAFLSSFRSVGKTGVGLITEVAQSTAFAPVSKVKRRATLVAIIILCLAFVAGTFFSDSITAPISKLRHATRRVREGDFDIKIINSGHDEIGKLTEAFVRMANEIKTKQNALVDQEKLVVAGRLARNIGHEFGNILQPLLSKLELLQDELKETEMQEQVSRVQEMIEFATLGAGICKGLLTLSKETSEAATFKPFNVREAAEKAMKLLAHEIKKKDVHVEIKVPKDLELLGNESQIMQVLINLAVNSLDAVNSGGHVTIEGHKDGPSTVLVVGDDGKGISEKNLKRVFEPLFSTKGAKGNGLGLSISKAIVELHGGTIKAESIKDSGTKMKIEFSNKSVSSLSHGEAAS